ncbi:hypothetical protein AQUCO_02000454v1 [Aquilegia coerulea]|uniref:DUF3511 domain-containing protein n=1 Tax=Aquilegia coerulea TaxID=218851 RepID=A0A2G5DHK2_AQUCA|nr:hypothetical protein AQUCO_02000454v1 [Aquilegia coerulea]
MEDYRSKSCGDGKMQIESYTAGGGGDNHQRPNSYDFRSYSTSYASSASSMPNQLPPEMGGGVVGKEVKFKKGKGVGSSSSSKGWSLNDPELQRKKRVASYKVYAVEGKMKGSFRKSFRWLKDRYTQVLYGWR